MLKGFLLPVEQKFQSIACVLGTFWFVWILLLILMKIVVKVSKTQAILWNFCSTASKNPFNTLGKSQFHPLLPILALFHRKTKPGFQKVHTAPNQPSPLLINSRKDGTNHSILPCSKSSQIKFQIQSTPGRMVLITPSFLAINLHR